MLVAEKVIVDGKEWIKAKPKHKSEKYVDIGMFNALKKVPGALFNPATGYWAIPYKNRAVMEHILKDYLIIWGEDEMVSGGIDENLYSNQPNMPGYSVEYNADGEIVGATGFKEPPWAEYQVRGFNALLDRKFLILADQPGLGKTFQVVTAIEARKKLGQLKFGIVLCKASLLYNWRDEIQKFSNEPAVVYQGTYIERGNILQKIYSNELPCTFLIMSYETYRNDTAGLSAIDDRLTFDFCIADEAQMIKNSQSKIGSAIYALPFEFRYVLTATPLPNTPLESYNYLRWGNVIDMNWFAFRKRYAVMGGYLKKEIVGYKKLGELRDLLQNNMLRRLKKDKLKDLPEVVFREIPVQMLPAQKKLYDGVLKGIMEELKETDLSSIPSMLAKLTRLQQVTDSPALIGGKNESAKLNALDDLLTDLIDEGGQKVILFTKSREMALLLIERYGKYNPAVIHGNVKTKGMSEAKALQMLREGNLLDGFADEEIEEAVSKASASDRMKEVYRFQDDEECRLFIGTAPACREGLTLTAATHVVFYDLEWAWDYVEQAFSRAHRIGQKNAVTVHFIYCKDTIDEKVFNVIKHKKSVSMAMLSTAKNEASNVAYRAKTFIHEMIA